MKKVFVASLCYQGVHGGGLYLIDDYFIFRTEKSQLTDEYRRIKIKYSDIESFTSYNALLIFPVILINLTNKKKFIFIVFNRGQCLKILVEKGIIRCKK